MPKNNQYNLDRTALPKDTKEVIGDKKPENLGLLINRMAHFAEKEDFASRWNLGSALSKELKAHFFHKSTKNKREYHLDLTQKWHLDSNQKEHYAIARERYFEAAASLHSAGIPFTLKADWRIALGMGNESVYENGFTFHPTYGIPYLPGSSLKGITRHWAKAEGKEEEPAYLKIFGHENDPQVESQAFRQGQVIFFDALPTELKPNMMQADIMNNHYPDYYEGNTYPADWLSPRPIFFLTMKEVSFQFQLGYLPRETTDGGTLLETASKWLITALEEMGIGAKTAVGYGRLRKADQAYTPPTKEELSELELEFTKGKSDKRLRNGDVFQAKVIKQGRPCDALLYGYSPNTYMIKVNGNVTKLAQGSIIKVRIQTDNAGKQITSASLAGILYQPKKP